MDILFNNQWFIQHLVEILSKQKSYWLDKNDILRLFCVNKACAQFASTHKIYRIDVHDNSNMPIWEKEYDYSSLYDAICDLHYTVNENDIYNKDDMWQLVFSLSTIYKSRNNEIIHIKSHFREKQLVFDDRYGITVFEDNSVDNNDDLYIHSSSSDKNVNDRGYQSS